MDIDFALKEYGLTEKEILIYLELLPLGTVTLQELSKRVPIPRTTVYNTLSYLHQKGMVSTVINKGTTQYSAASPKKLVDNLDERRALLKKILPNLEVLQNNKKTASNTELYHGSKGLFTILSDVFSKKRLIKYFGSYALSKEVLKHQPEHFRTLRLERNIPAHIIIENTDEPTFHQPHYKALTQMRFLDSLKDFPCMIFIYENKVALYTLKGDLTGIIVTNKEYSQAMNFIFETYWNTAREAKL